MSKKWWIIIIVILIVLIWWFFLIEILSYEKCRYKISNWRTGSCKKPIYEKRYDKVFYKWDWCLTCCDSVGRNYAFKCQKTDYMECSGLNLELWDDCVVPADASYLENYLDRYYK